MEEKEENQELIDHEKRDAGQKMQSWMTCDLELRNIILTEEQFCIQAKFCILWQDPQEKFRVKVDENIIKQIKEKGMNHKCQFYNQF